MGDESEPAADAEGGEASAFEAVPVEPPPLSLSSPPQCQCKVEAIRTTVTKEGPHFGRPFYKCSKEACNLFEWEAVLLERARPVATPLGPPRVPPIAAAQTGAAPNAAAAASPSSAENQADGNCNCGKEAVSNIVKKEGPNQGKRFLSCKERTCKFFKWADVTTLPAPG